jgi:hypothetical protein
MADGEIAAGRVRQLALLTPLTCTLIEKVAPWQPSSELLIMWTVFGRVNCALSPLAISRSRPERTPLVPMLFCEKSPK